MNLNDVEKYLGSFFKVGKSNLNIHRNFNLRIKSSFEFEMLNIEKKDFVIAVNKREHFSVSEFDFMRDEIITKVKAPVIFYFDELTSQNKKSLVSSGISYIVSNRQFFIKELAIHNNDFYDYKPLRRKKLTISSQNILFKLLDLDRHEIPRKGLSKMLQEEPYEISRGLKVLIENELIQVRKKDGLDWVVMNDKRDVWERAKKLLKSPIIDYFYIDSNDVSNHENELYLSGVSALSERTMLVSKEVVYAVENKNFKLWKKPMVDYDIFPNSVKIEVWKSDIPNEKGIINRFALYFSLKDEKDERVESEFEELLEERLYD